MIGNESQAAADIRRGLGRFLRHQGWVWLPEIKLPNKRRADVMGLNSKGQLLIVEVKSCLADYQSDAKWQDYQPYCDFFGFAVNPEFPQHVLPADVGLIVADAYGADQLRPYAQDLLAPARRKAMLQRFAEQGALRVMAMLDP